MGAFMLPTSILAGWSRDNSKFCLKGEFFDRIFWNSECSRTEMDQSMRNINVSRYQFDLLMQVALEDGINQQTCANRMNVTKVNITQHIDRLEKRELIRRQKEAGEIAFT